LRLKPNELHKVQVLFEFAPDAEQSDPRVDKEKQKYIRMPNHVNIIGLIENPGDKRLHGPTLISGVTAEVVTGKSTKFKDLRNDGRQLLGIVSTKDDEEVAGGNVIITLHDKSNKILKSIETKILRSGEFVVILDSSWVWLDAYYVGPHGYADCQVKFKNSLLS